LHKIYPDAPLFTLVHNPKTAPWAKVFKVIPTFFNQIPFLKTRHEWLAPFASLAFETFDFNQYDLVISVTSSDAKSIITQPKTLHICYCLTPTRYFWSQPFPKLLNFLLPYFKKLDLLISHRPDFYLAISNEVQKRLKDFYNQPSQVIYPPIDYEFFAKTKRNKSDYYLVVSRLVPYKKIDLVIKL
jgi:glycosyltransferase involved in cell wall biosynthesis